MAPSIYLILAIILWSTAFVGIRFALYDFTPGSIALFRFFIAAIILLIFYFQLSKKTKLNWRQIGLLFLIGPIGIGGYSLMLNHSEQTLSAGIACFIVALTPVFSNILAVLYLKETYTKRLFLGVLISLIGLFLIAFQDIYNLQYELALLFALVTVIFGSIQALAQKIILKELSALEVITWATWMTLVFLTFYIPDLVHDLSKASSFNIAVCIYLGIAPSFIAQWCWSHALSRIPLVQANAYLFLMPLITTFIGLITLGEFPKTLALLGGIIAALGAYISVHRA